MKSILKLSLLGVVGIVLSGCTGKFIDKVGEEEVNKYEKTYLAEYESIKQQNINYKPPFQWVQPKNKKEECKVYVSINPNDDKTKRVDYSLYWDGDCKDGYAYGLGREIENTMLNIINTIGDYKNGKAIDYMVMFDTMNGMEINGIGNVEEGSGHFVMTKIDNKFGNFNIEYEFGFFSLKDSRKITISTSPFNDLIVNTKVYPNFSYVLQDYTKNEFDNKKYVFFIKNKEKKPNGYSFMTFKQGEGKAAEFVDDMLIREVEIPQDYLKKADLIFNEIKKEANIALDAQNKALIIKEKYKNKICRDSVKVDFIDNKEYKEICNENEKIAQLKTKIDTKLAQIEQQKQAKRQQQNEQRLIKVREVEAMAAQRQAEAAEMANFNQSMQNLNNNMQMQQLNNNLMMYNTMPKRYDVYVH